MHCIDALTYHSSLTSHAESILRYDKERLASETESNTGPEIRNCWHLHVYKANIDGKICRFNEALTYGRIYFVSHSCLYTYNASSRSLKQQLLVSCKCLNHEHTCRFLSDVKTL